ncbi:hypothetical protein EMCG_04176 [[Emmonsia] crescens]|uniref:Uncharacterized protein n=1 Tax=[Emmonsia] crescens TaxID=73230 RepID=A0A0G2J7T2_9EURO|nr:hypothetical protein EMCG_04176 [Emmonsia crescens UAMH 3008]
MDLSSLRSVRNTAAKIINQAVDTIDVVLSNVGIIALPERKVSGNGFEMHSSLLSIGHFLLTNLPMDKIRLAATKRPGFTRRIVHVALLCSVTNFPPIISTGPVAVDEAVVEEWLKAHAIKPYNSMIAYGQLKTGNITICDISGEISRKSWDYFSHASSRIAYF